MIRRAVFTFALGLALASYALPQEPAGQKEHAEQADPMLGWKWANFAHTSRRTGWRYGSSYWRGPMNRSRFVG